jgi:hypothetical protein
VRTTAERFRRIEAIYAAARSRPPADRARFLESECAGDEELLRQVSTLLESPVSDVGFLSVPAAAMLVGDATLPPAVEFDDPVVSDGQRLG